MRPTEAEWKAAEKLGKKWEEIWPEPPRLTYILGLNPFNKHNMRLARQIALRGTKPGVGLEVRAALKWNNFHRFPLIIAAVDKDKQQFEPLPQTKGELAAQVAKFKEMALNPPLRIGRARGRAQVGRRPGRGSRLYFQAARKKRSKNTLPRRDRYGRFIVTRK